MSNLQPDIRENIPLAPLTTLGVGGPARFFLEAATEDDVIRGLDFAAPRQMPVFILGGGSNILVSDAGFDGLVIHIAIKGIQSESAADGGMILNAGSGENWDALVEYAVANGLAGIECLSGIPGNVGGTPVQNVGAYGQEVSETIVTVRCYDRSAGAITELPAQDCGFAYRKSIFNTTEKDRYVVLAVRYLLRAGGQPKVVYKDLIEYFGDVQPTLRDVREAVLKIRKSKSMVLDPADPNSRSAGSFFKNPVIPVATLAKMFARSDQPIPNFRAEPGFVKVPAAWLIEQAGFAKGYRHGNAGISSNHSLAIINFGAASAAEIVELSDLIRRRVMLEFDIELQPEPVFVGFPYS